MRNRRNHVPTRPLPLPGTCDAGAYRRITAVEPTTTVIFFSTSRRPFIE